MRVHLHETAQQKLAHARVRAGVKFLDRHFAGWVQVIDVEHLSISGYNNPLLQLVHIRKPETSVSEFMCRVNLTVERTVKYGLCQDPQVTGSILDAEWASFITTRRYRLAA